MLRCPAVRTVLKMAAGFRVCCSLLFLIHSGISSPVFDGPEVSEDVSWPGFPYLRQVSGLAVDSEGNLHLFHRGDRIWDESVFDNHHQLKRVNQGPIPNDTVLVVDTGNARVLRSWGSNRFYVPHGITIDKKGNTWLTDVGLHQVFRFPLSHSDPDLILGESMVPGSNPGHFCQPTDVAVLDSGHFFVADGYCNSRVLLFAPDGRMIQQIGHTDDMRVPHSLTLVPEHSALCAADRENGRVLCYASGADGATEPGTPLVDIQGQGVARVYAIDAKGGDLFVLNGPDVWESVSSNHGLVLDIETGLPKSLLWGPEKGFELPHAMAVSPDGKYVYVSDIAPSAPKKVYKFTITE